nr:hypothetical protein [Tanacetum cinerariifolium]
MNDFCAMKCIRREFSIARTPQQNGVAERRNMTLIKAARTMLADSKLPITFWAEAVNTACYVQNRVLVVKTHNKTPSELFRGNRPKWLFDIDVLTESMNYVPVVTDGSLFDSSSKNASSDAGHKDDKGNESEVDNQEKSKNITQDVNTAGPSTNTTSTNVNTEVDMSNITTTYKVHTTPNTRIHKDHSLDHVIGDVQYGVLTRRMTKTTNDQGFILVCLLVSYLRKNPRRIKEEVYVCQPPGFEDPDHPDKVYKVVKALYGLNQAPRAWRAHFLLRTAGDSEKCWIFISQDKYIDEILKMFGFSTVKTSSTPMETSKPLLKDEKAEDVNVYLYRLMIGSLMYLTALRPDIMFVVCACARFQVTPKVLHLHVVKRIFRYLKGKPKLGLWYPKDSLFELQAYTDSDYDGASLDKKSTTGGCQFLRSRLNSCTICIVKNLVFHFKTKYNKIRHHFIRDSNEKKLIQMIKNHIDQNIADLLTKAFDVGRFQYLVASIGMLTSEVLIKGRLEAKLNAASSKLMLLSAMQALVDKKKVIVIERSVKSDLHLEDVEDMGEDSEIPTDSHHTPTISQPSTSSQPQQKHKSKKSKKKITEERMIDDLDADEEVTLVDETQERNDQHMYDISVLDDEKVLLKRKLVLLIQFLQLIMVDDEVARNLEAQMQTELEEERLARQKEEEVNIALIKSWDNIQAMIDANYMLAIRIQEEERGELTIKEKSRLFVELMDKRKKCFARLRDEKIIKLVKGSEKEAEHNEKAVEGSSKKQENMVYYLLVEKMYPFTRNILHQIWNDVRLQVDYEVDMAYDLLRLIRMQINEGYVPE